MPTFSAHGFTPRSLADFVDDLTADFRSVLGADMSTAPESVQMQIIGALALRYARADEEAISVGAGMSLYESSGSQIDDWGTLLGMARRAGTRSTVRLTLTGAPNVIVPEGSRVQSNTGVIFATDSAVTIPVGRSIEVDASAVEVGAVVAGAGTITTLVDVIAGWDGVTNVAPAVAGEERETDAAYRLRYTARSSAHARDGLSAIRARLLSVDGVQRVVVRDNSTSSAVNVQGVSIPAHAVLSIVQGGADSDVAEAIAQTKPVGIPTTGTETVSNVQPGGGDIMFSRAVPTRVLVAVTISVGPMFPPDGINRIQQRVAEWGVGEWSSGIGDFDLSGLAIGEGVVEARLYSPINSVPGHEVTALAVTDASSNALPAVTPLATLYTIDAADVTVTIS